jgi:hypothetical protein
MPLERQITRIGVKTSMVLCCSSLACDDGDIRAVKFPGRNVDHGCARHAEVKVRSNQNLFMVRYIASGRNELLQAQSVRRAIRKISKLAKIFKNIATLRKPVEWALGVSEGPIGY